MKKSATLPFSSEVTNRMGGETLTACYQCGTCASSCPVAKITPKFNPREVIKLSLLGEKDEVVAGEAIFPPNRIKNPSLKLGLFLSMLFFPQSRRSTIKSPTHG